MASFSIWRYEKFAVSNQEVLATQAGWHRDPRLSAAELLKWISFACGLFWVSFISRETLYQKVWLLWSTISKMYYGISRADGISILL